MNKKWFNYKAYVRHIDYVSPYLVLLADCVLAMSGTLISYLLLSYLLKLVLVVGILFRMLLVSTLSYLVIALLLRSYRGIIRHSSMSDMLVNVYGFALKGVALLLFFYLTEDYVGNFWYGVVILDFLIEVTILFVFRSMLVRAYYIITTQASDTRLNTLIYSTTDSAISLANFLRSGSDQYKVVGFLTLRPDRHLIRFVGNTAYYAPTLDSIVKLIERLNVKCVLFMNNTDLHQNEALLNYGLKNNLNFRLAPLMESGKSSAGVQLRSVQIEDLLGRDEIKINLQTIREQLSGKVVMVTGAAGSIGSELCRQLCKIGVGKLVLFDFSETASYQIDLELKQKYPDIDLETVIGDVRDLDRVESIVSWLHPNIIYHAAAYKHVPLMEEYPCEAIRTNLRGTKNVADTALKFGIEKFIMISTDKAVRPSSVMGATKRLAEMYVQGLGAQIKEGALEGHTSFVTTRFGNVLGSNGSVVPLFRKQIIEGGPVTVTHPEVTRFFMTIPEACRLVLEASFLGQGNDIFMFDMGKPVKIVDLARRMIQLSGYVPDKDIQIRFSGLRHGEKLYEELLYTKEDTTPTDNPLIFRALSVKYDFGEITRNMESLFELARRNDRPGAVAEMRRIMPEYQSCNPYFN